MVEYIKREDALEAMEWKWAGKAAFDAVKAIPPADVVERKRGKWINYKCSECGEPIPISKVILRGKVMWEKDQKPNFCPNCGAQMREVDDD